MDKEIFFRVYKNKVLNSIINNGIRFIHRLLYSKYNVISYNQLMDSPIVLSQYGYIDQFKAHYDKSIKNYYDTLYLCGKKASRYGHISILKCFIERDILTPYSLKMVFANSLAGGHIATIEYLYSILNDNKEIMLKQCFDSIAESGSIEICEWFSNHFRDINDTHIIHRFFYNAAFLGKLDVLKWGTQYFDNKIGLDPLIWEHAIKSKNIEILEYMYNQQFFKVTFNTRCWVITAIKNSNISVIDWFFSKTDCPTYNIRDLLLALIERNNIRLIKNFPSIMKFKIWDYKNEAEWFFKVCGEQGINPIDYSIQHRKFFIMKWLFEDTGFTNTINPFTYIFTGPSNGLDILDWFTISKRPDIIPIDTLNHLLAYCGNLTIVEYIIRNRTEVFTTYHRHTVLDYVLINSKSLDLAEWMIKNKNVNCSSYGMDNSIARNRLDVVKWIHENTTTRCSRTGIISAYYLNDPAMVEWLHNNRTESCNAEDINFSRCKLPIQTFIIYNKPDLIPLNIFELANGDFSITKYIIDTYQDNFIYDDTLFILSNFGKVENIMYLHEYYKKNDINQDTNHFNMHAFKQSLEVAIKYDYFDIVKYLCDNGPKIKKSTGNKQIDQPMLVACKYGRLDICKYLQEHSVDKINLQHMDVASANGFLDLVQWITESHGIKCSSNGLETSAINRHFNVVRYLLENKHELTSKMFNNAILRKDLEFVTICQEYKCKIDGNAVDLASSIGSLEIVKYLVENGYKGSNDAIDSASENGYLDVIVFLRKNEHKCTPKSINSATKNSHYEVVKWLTNNIEFPSSTVSDRIRSSPIKSLIVEYKKKLEAKENDKKRDCQDDDNVVKRTNKKQKK